MLSKSSFFAISLLIFSSPSLAVYRGLFSQKRMQDDCSVQQLDFSSTKREETDRLRAKWVQAHLAHKVPRVKKARQVKTPPFFDAYLRKKTRYPVNDGREFRMILTTQLFRRFTSVFCRETTELREVTAERKSAVVEPIWLRTARNLTIMAYGDFKLRTPVWSSLYDGEDEVVRIIDSSDPDYPPKLSTETTGSESGVGQPMKATGGKSTETTGVTPTAPAKSVATKATATATKPLVKSTKAAATRPTKA
ncbi:hypothetical protein ARMGADRAFT_1062917, partial [Armillaria gallica]